MATSPLRRTFGLLSSLLLASLMVGGFAGTAHAADGYRYWNYFHVNGAKYVFAKTGASDHKPKDGATEAYRYGTSSTAAGIKPRADLTRYAFAKICAGVESTQGKKRVAVILDYGTKSDAGSGETPPAPRAACATVPDKANGQQVLESVADVRFDKFTCGIDGYPIKTCSVTVKAPENATAEQPVSFQLPASQATADGATDGTTEEGGNNLVWPLVGVVAAVVVIGGGALAMSRRNNSA